MSGGVDSPRQEASVDESSPAAPVSNPLAIASGAQTPLSSLTKFPFGSNNSEAAETIDNVRHVNFAAQEEIFAISGASETSAFGNSFGNSSAGASGTSTVVVKDMPGSRGAITVASMAKPGRFTMAKENLGTARFGPVHLVLDSASGELVVVKRFVRCSTPTRSADVLLEVHRKCAEVVQNVTPHPNIVRYFGTDYVVTQSRLMMEYVGGASLEGLIRAKGPLAEKSAAAVLAQAMLGLQHIHDLGVDHGNFRCANLLLDMMGTVRVTDYGIEGIDYSLPHANPEWMAPEVYKERVLGGEVPPGAEETEREVPTLDQRIAADTWSVGCCLVELLDGKSPTSLTADNKACSVGEVLRRAGRPVSLVPDAVAKTWSPEAVDFYIRCVRSVPSKRPTIAALLKHEYIQNNVKFRDNDTAVVVPDDLAEALRTFATKTAMETAARGPSANTTRPPPALMESTQQQAATDGAEPAAAAAAAAAPQKHSSPTAPGAPSNRGATVESQDVKRRPSASPPPQQSSRSGSGAFLDDGGSRGGTLITIDPEESLASSTKKAGVSNSIVEARQARSEEQQKTATKAEGGSRPCWVNMFKILIACSVLGLMAAIVVAILIL